jgi:hypothetical protein
LEIAIRRFSAVSLELSPDVRETVFDPYRDWLLRAGVMIGERVVQADPMRRIINLDHEAPKHIVSDDPVDTAPELPFNFSEGGFLDLEVLEFGSTDLKGTVQLYSLGARASRVYLRGSGAGIEDAPQWARAVEADRHKDIRPVGFEFDGDVFCLSRSGNHAGGRQRCNEQRGDGQAHVSQL